MKRKMSKAEKDARHLPLEEEHWIEEVPSYAYSYGRKINLITGKDEISEPKTRNSLLAWVLAVLGTAGSVTALCVVTGRPILVFSAAIGVVILMAATLIIQRA